MTKTKPVPAIGRGLSLEALLMIAHAFLLLSCVGSVVVLAGGGDLAGAGLGQLSAAVLFEVLSWAAYPLLAFVFLQVFRMTGGDWRLLWATLGAAALSEVPYDMATSGQLRDMSSQSPLWALPVGFILAAAWGYASGRPSTGEAVLLRVGVVLGGLAWVVMLNVGLRFGLYSVGAVTLIFLVCFLWLWGRENTMMLCAGLLGAGLMVSPAVGTIFLHYRAPLIEESGRIPAWHWLLLYPAMLLAAGGLGMMVR